MRENALISHYRYKSVRSLFFETFKHLLYPNATTKTSYGITGECKSFKRRQLFSNLYCALDTKSVKTLKGNNGGWLKKSSTINIVVILY